jgi:hypothetical protein
VVPGPPLELQPRPASYCGGVAETCVNPPVLDDGGVNLRIRLFERERRKRRRRRRRIKKYGNLAWQWEKIRWEVCEQKGGVEISIK